MVPEAYGAQVLPDPDYGPKNMILPYNFCLVEAVDTP